MKAYPRAILAYFVSPEGVLYSHCFNCDHPYLAGELAIASARSLIKAAFDGVGLDFDEVVKQPDAFERLDRARGVMVQVVNEGKLARNGKIYYDPQFRSLMNHPADVMYRVLEIDGVHGSGLEDAIGEAERKMFEFERDGDPRGADKWALLITWCQSRLREAR